MKPTHEAACPVCGEHFSVSLTPAMPFCSKRCRDIDLGRWIDERNRMPVEPTWDDDDLDEIVNEEPR